MTVCGLKLSHDSSIAVIKDNTLLFSIEWEKLNNNARFKIMDNIASVEKILTVNKISIDEIDVFAVDGWVGEHFSKLKVRNNTDYYELMVAPYIDGHSSSNSLRAMEFDGLRIGNKSYSYVSYSHVAGHILSAYATSPFCQQLESAFILVWDGGMFPRMYFIDPRSETTLQCLGPLFYFGVNIYSIFGQHFGPFKINENVIKDELSMAGKIMAYTAYGMRKEEIIRKLKDCYQRTVGMASNENCLPTYPYIFTSAFKEAIANDSFFDEDILTSFHYFIEELLIAGISCVSRNCKYSSPNLCVSGGAALNIKWNSAIRKAGIFKNIYIPPFPNDSGSAIGVACCAMANMNQSFQLNWNLYSGPSFIHNESVPGWSRKSCSLKELASILYEYDEPVAILNGKSELGPRALGNRSIVASPVSAKMKNRLNFIKYREPYRPIAPICLEERAADIFSPGIPDPYMLFSHAVRQEWKMRIPAVCHEDDSSRLQTVNRNSHQILYELLIEFEKVSGIPVLCNTSANFKGSGFFPDLYSATRWGKLKFVWCEGILYQNCVTRSHAKLDSTMNGHRVGQLQEFF